MRLLLMFDAKVGNAIADWLLENHPTDLGAVVSVGESERIQAARGKGIPCFVFQSESQLMAQLAELPSFDLGILAWWPKIISSGLLSLPKQGFVNTHPSLLPYNRGKHYNFWALVEQAPFGVTLHYVDQGIDSGDIVAQKTISYGWEDTGETLYLKAGQAMLDLFKSAYPVLRSGVIPRVPQDISKGSLHYAREIDAVSKIDLERSYTARDLLNLLRARTFPGYPACHFEDGGDEYEISVKIKRKSV